MADRTKSAVGLAIIGISLFCRFDWMTYKSGRWITWPEFNFAEENLTRLLAKVKPNFNTYQIVDDCSKKKEFVHLQSRLMIVSPLVERMKN